MLNFKILSNQNISDTPSKFIDPSQLENLKQYLDIGQTLLALGRKITENGDSLASFLVHKITPTELNDDQKVAYQENFKFLLQYLTYYIVSGGREDILDALREEISAHFVPEFMSPTLNSFVSFACASFAENNHFSPEENEVLAEYIVGFNNLLKKINDQENLQEKLLHWFDEVERLEVLPSESCTPYQQSLVEKYRAKGLTL